ncbi:hypothetical protein [Bdellovibrio svalbardensis]|uniref:DUF3008 domain-containing protein n=1 Tax=Bdellovibrio svalbardensis TaxID=2972972 RepID=A0ABT6DHF8_9BACT|nr:hypothetical protein [Bdellovibrio svalbardensis]MDG0816292.1 hypothetical protein [Bdellovibrio svalbardensis]
MSRHHKNRGFSQTSKKYDGELKALHQQVRSKQIDHSAETHGSEEEASENKDAKHSSSGFKKGK